MKNLQIFYPKKFKILAITIDPGFDDFDCSYIKNLCNSYDIPFVVEKSYIKQIVFDERKEKNPCSLCANLRRGILNSVAIREGCNKIALGHNMDDLIETFFLNLLYGGRIHSFSPVSFQDRSGITVIRPLLFAEEKDVIRFIKKENITPMHKCCPMDGHSKRENMKDLIDSFKTDIPNIKANLFGAIKRSDIKGWK